MMIRSLPTQTTLLTKLAWPNIVCSRVPVVASQIRTPLPPALVLAICLPSGENVASAISSAIPLSVRAAVPAGIFQTVARWSTPPVINCAPEGEK